MRISLNKTEKVIAVVPELGANAPLYIHILDYSNNKYRSVCIQPEDQSANIRILFGVVAAADAAMKEAVEKYIIYKK